MFEQVYLQNNMNTKLNDHIAPDIIVIPRPLSNDLWVSLSQSGWNICVCRKLYNKINFISDTLFIELYFIL